MSGIVHLRVVVIIFVVGGIVSLLPFALSFFMDGVHTSVSQLVGGIGGVAIAIWFSRGSHIARYIMITLRIVVISGRGTTGIGRHRWRYGRFLRLLPVGFDVLQGCARRTFPPQGGQYET
jgi:hypothetical protein